MNRFEQLDVTAFDRYYGGVEHSRSVQIYLKLANLFMKGLDLKLEELHQALISHEQQDAKIIAHRIRGSLLSLGGNQIASIFHEIEYGLGSTPDSDLLQLVQTKKSEIDQFILELKAWMETLETSIKPVL